MVFQITDCCATVDSKLIDVCTSQLTFLYWFSLFDSHAPQYRNIHCWLTMAFVLKTITFDFGWLFDTFNHGITLKLEKLLANIKAFNVSSLHSLVLRLTPPGRTDLIEEPIDPRVNVDDYGPSEQVYTYSQQRQQRFEIGVDVANSANTSTGTTAVEWSLWKRTGPKQNLRTPFVIHRHFLQDAPKMHSKQVCETVTEVDDASLDNFVTFKITNSTNGRIACPPIFVH